jgi:hypothetical protein
MWEYFGNKGSTITITLARVGSATTTMIATGIAIEAQR